MEVGDDGQLWATIEDIKPAIADIIDDVLKLIEPTSIYYRKYADDITSFVNFLRHDLPDCCAGHTMTVISHVRTDMHMTVVLCKSTGCTAILNHKLAEEIVEIIDTHMDKCTTKIATDQMLYEHRN